MARASRRLVCAGALDIGPLPLLNSAPAPPLPLNNLLCSAHTTPFLQLSPFCSTPRLHTFPAIPLLPPCTSHPSYSSSLCPWAWCLPLSKLPSPLLALPSSPTPHTVSRNFLLGKAKDSTPFTYFTLSFCPLHLYLSKGINSLWQSL